jgi:imidazolonepropionase-like amidohydrolase
MKYPIKGFLIFCLVFSNLGFSQPTVIKAKAYVDVVSGKLIEPANIVIEDGKISAINPKIFPQNFVSIELPNKILLPGLMDMHTHLDADFNGSFDHFITKESIIHSFRYSVIICR